MMRFSLRPLAVSCWITVLCGHSLTTLAAPEEGSPNERKTGVNAPSEATAQDANPREDAARGGTAAPRTVESTSENDSDDVPSPVPPEEDTAADPAAEEGELLDASSLLSEEELRALEAEFGDATENTVAPGEPSPDVTDSVSETFATPQTQDAKATAPVAPDSPEAALEQEGEPAGEVEAALGTRPTNDELQEPAASLGKPRALSQREPTLAPFQLEGGLRYGLVGTGPTRFVDDLRFAWAEGVELRTSFTPYPSSLMLRLQAGKSAGDFGAWIMDAGIANWDAGWRLVVDTGEATVGARFHWELVLAWQRAMSDRMSWFTAAHLRYRMSGLPDDEQRAVAFESLLTYDLMSTFSVSAGVGYARTLGTPVREVAVSFVETGRPGVTHFLVRDDALDEDLSPARARQSLTLPLALTYGSTESFDVDLFCTPRVFPKFDIVFGAGVRIRYDLR